MFTEYGVIRKRGIQVLCGRVRTRERCHGRREHPLALQRYRCKYNNYISKPIDSRIKVYNSKHVHIMFWTCFDLYKFYTPINQFLYVIVKLNVSQLLKAVLFTESLPTVARTSIYLIVHVITITFTMHYMHH